MRVRNTSGALENETFALEFDDDSILSRVMPVVPLNVPYPHSHSDPETAQYGTITAADPQPAANV
jgi:hypothetical protein